MELASSGLWNPLDHWGFTRHEFVYPLSSKTDPSSDRFKGMYVGKLDLTILNDDLVLFLNVSTKRNFGETLRNVTAQLGNAKLAEAERKQLPEE